MAPPATSSQTSLPSHVGPMARRATLAVAFGPADERGGGSPTPKSKPSRRKKPAHSTAMSTEPESREHGVTPFVEMERSGHEGQQAVGSDGRHRRCRRRTVDGPAHRALAGGADRITGRRSRRGCRTGRRSRTGRRRRTCWTRSGSRRPGRLQQAVDQPGLTGRLGEEPAGGVGQQAAGRRSSRPRRAAAGCQTVAPAAIARAGPKPIRPARTRSRSSAGSTSRPGRRPGT